MRVVFAGTPPFAARALEALAESFDVVGVLTQPDRPAGRGMKLTPSAVAEAAQRLEIPVFKPVSLKGGEALGVIAPLSCDVMVVAAYGLIIPPDVLALPRHGCINIHASLLPRWRGAAPIQRALLAGDAITGISIMQMDAGLDTGPVLATETLPIGPLDTTGTLTDKLAEVGARLVVSTLADLHHRVAQPQDDHLATYAAKIRKLEARIDWTRDSAELERAIRAFDPAPGAETRLEGHSMKVWKARLAEGSGRPGEVLQFDASGWIVACGKGALQLLEVQRAGGKRVTAAQFAHGSAVRTGTLLETH